MATAFRPNVPLVLPEIAEPLGRKFTISNRMLDVLVTEILLQRPSIHTLIGQKWAKTSSHTLRHQHARICRTGGLFGGCLRTSWYRTGIRERYEHQNKFWSSQGHNSRDTRGCACNSCPSFWPAGDGINE